MNIIYCKYIYIAFFRMGVLCAVKISCQRSSLSEDRSSLLSDNWIGASPIPTEEEAEMRSFLIRGIIWGLVFSVPIWVLILVACWLVKRIGG